MVVANGMEAVTAARSASFDIILMDLQAGLLQPTRRGPGLLGFTTLLRRLAASRRSPEL